MSRLLILALLTATSIAHAQQSRRVVVQRFGGPNASSVRAQLIANLLEQPGIEVVDDEEVAAARAQLGLGTRVRGEQYVQLARQLRVSAFIDGIVSRRRRHWAATIRVRNGATGEELGSASWGGRTAAALNGVRRAYPRIQPYLEASSVPTGAPAAARSTARAPVEEEEEERPPWYAQRDDEEPDEPDQPPAPSGPSERYDAIRVALAGGTLFRWMHTIASVYAVQRGMSPAMPSSELLDEDRRYQSGGIGHFEPGILFEIYPGAIPDPQVFPYLGLVFSFTHSAFVQTSGNPPRASPGDPIPIPTDQLELYVGLRGRYRFGQARRDPEVFLDLGYGLFEFLLGTDALQLIERSTIIPTYSTSYVQIGGGARYGIIPTYLTVGVDLAARIGTTIGADTRNIWGVETGAPFGFAFGVEARSEIPEIVRGFFVALRLSYFMFTTTYRGQVGCAEPGGCGGMINPWEDTRLWEIWPVDPSTPTQLDNVVGGVRDAVNDNYFRIQLQVGWQY